MTTNVMMIRFFGGVARRAITTRAAAAPLGRTPSLLSTILTSSYVNVILLEIPPIN